jgi:peptidoglycan/xylan/chitin deacetylase (PgdA/CDA1 family)
MINYPEMLCDDGYVIYLFHGVIREQRHSIRNYTHKHILIDKFISIVRDLCRQGMPVSMPDIVAASYGKKGLPPRAFAITFDDGFENNYSIAAPVLADLGIPATFYITTDFIESNISSWIDLIEYAVEKVDRVELNLPYPGMSGVYETDEQKIAWLGEIRRFIKSAAQIDPYGFALEIWNQLNITAMEIDRDLDQKMTWEQVRELHCGDLFTIGGHGHTHRVLAFLDRTELEKEVIMSLEKLRAQLEGPIEHYSYPEGLTNCYSKPVIDVLRRHGILCAPTAESGANRLGDSLFHLKRVMVD